MSAESRRCSAASRGRAAFPLLLVNDVVCTGAVAQYKTGDCRLILGAKLVGSRCSRSTAGLLPVGEAKGETMLSSPAVVLLSCLLL